MSDQVGNPEDRFSQNEALMFQVKNLVVINVSPLEHGHILLIPDIYACRPQVSHGLINVCPRKQYNME